MKNLIVIVLSFFLFAGSISAQERFKLDRDETGEVINEIDWRFPFPQPKFPGPILKKLESNRQMIQKKYGLSDKQYNAIARRVVSQLRDKSPKELKMMQQTQFRKANGDIKWLMQTVANEYQEDNSNVQAQQSGLQDILDAGVAGATIGAALGAGIGAAAGSVGGPKGAAAGAAIGGAIGGALGAAAGLGAGSGRELAEEVDPTLEDN
jgi:hypothetical protein